MSLPTNSIKPDESQDKMPALTGIRFFAILHIFCFHLWTLYDMKKEPRFENILHDMSYLPDAALTYISHGWMSTSFFFLLSGFMLAYLYWGQDGKLSIPAKKFWILRFTRLYPIHFLLTIIAFITMTHEQLSMGIDVPMLIASGIATLALMQAWYPDFVPIWSWPTWTISTLVFLYLVMPFILPMLAKLSRTNAIIFLCMLPLVSLIPTYIYSLYFPTGSTPKQFWQIFISSTPIFWLAHFVAGILLSKVFAISRYNAAFNEGKKTWLAWGDLALLTVIGIACVPGIEEPFKYFLRHGLMMPLYMVIIIDLARGKGLFARLFSLPGMGFLGETGFSIFIWQNFVITMCWALIVINPAAGNHQFMWAVIGMILISVFSAYLLEKPLSKWLRLRLTK